MPPLQLPLNKERSMAITAIEYVLFSQMRQQNAIPLGGDCLELGEANWYGDVAVEQLGQDIYRFAKEEERTALFRQLDEITQAKRPGMLFEIAKVFWRTFWQPCSMTAVDLHGTEAALKLDLNFPIELPQRYHAVFNLGTAEHIFNIAQVMKTIHDYTLPGGLMIHGLPFTGWLDHGFYNVQPTFFWDLAQANSYTIMAYLYVEYNPLKFVQLWKREDILELVTKNQIGQNALLYCVLRKPAEDQPFCFPIQGYYAGTLSQEAAEAWKTLR
jgi:hypothetical protein